VWAVTDTGTIGTTVYYYLHKYNIINISYSILSMAQNESSNKSKCKPSHTIKTPTPRDMIVMRLDINIMKIEMKTLRHKMDILEKKIDKQMIDDD